MKKQGTFIQMRLDTWNDVVYAAWGCSHDQFLHKVKKDFAVPQSELDIMREGIEGVSGRCWQLCHRKLILMWFNKPYTYRTIIHECFHATTFLLGRKGLKLSDDSDEAYAYMLDYLSSTVINTFKEERVKLK